MRTIPRMLLLHQARFGLLISSLVAAAAASMSALPAPARGESLEQAKDIVATAVRRRGYACNDPKEAKRDPARSRAHVAIWMLSCANAVYQVEFVLDRTARVEPLE